MTDLVDRLLADAYALDYPLAQTSPHSVVTISLEREAAAEIKHLRTLLARIYDATTEGKEGLTLADVQNICRPFAKSKGDGS